MIRLPACRFPKRARRGRQNGNLDRVIKERIMQRGSQMHDVPKTTLDDETRGTDSVCASSNSLCRLPILESNQPAQAVGLHTAWAGYAARLCRPLQTSSSGS